MKTKLKKNEINETFFFSFIFKKPRSCAPVGARAHARTHFHAWQRTPPTGHCSNPPNIVTKYPSGLPGFNVPTLPTQWPARECWCYCTCSFSQRWPAFKSGGVIATSVCAITPAPGSRVVPTRTSTGRAGARSLGAKHTRRTGSASQKNSDGILPFCRFCPTVRATRETRCTTTCVARSTRTARLKVQRPSAPASLVPWKGETVRPTRLRWNVPRATPAARGRRAQHKRR